MGKKQKIATVFGGTGFIGRQVVSELAKLGYIIKVASRAPESAYFLRICGAVGQVVPFACNYKDAESISAAVKGADVVVNCIGILFEKGKKRRFQFAHVDVPANIASACAKHGVKRLVHLSALGVDVARSKYAKSKLEGEKAVLNNFPKATILRPSVVFGEDDEFFNMFSRMAQVLPFLPLIGGGKTKFQPVFVGNVASAVIAAITLEGDKCPQGQTYELGGPEVLSLKEIYKMLLRHTNLKTRLVSLPFSLAKLQSQFFRVLPKPPLTPDQVESLKYDNVVSDKARQLEGLGVTSTSLDLVLPTYLHVYRPGGVFGEKAA